MKSSISLKERTRYTLKQMKKYKASYGFKKKQMKKKKKIFFLLFFCPAFFNYIPYIYRCSGYYGNVFKLYRF